MSIKPIRGYDKNVIAATSLLTLLSLALPSAASARSADLSITKTGPASVSPGANVVYTITVTNGGPNATSQVKVYDTTPSGLTFVSNSGSCTTAFPCSLGSLSSGNTRTITSTYLVPASYTAPNPIVNTATVSGHVTDPATGNNTSSASTPLVVADLAVTSSGPASATPGSNLVLTVVVTNNGPSSASSVSVANPTPSGLTFVSNSGACTTAYPCALGTLASGATRTITSTYSLPS